MSDEDRQGSTVEDRISRARERMSMDYEDKPAPRPAMGSKVAGNKVMDMVSGFLGSESGTRRLAYGAAGLGGLLVLGIGGWAVLGHHQSGIPVMGPPPVAMRTKPVDPGGMQLDTLALPDADANQQGHPVPAPEKPNPAALAAQYGGTPDAAPAGAVPPTADATGGHAGEPAADAAATGAATPEPAQPATAPAADGAPLKPVPSAALPAQAGGTAEGAEPAAPEPLKEAPVPTDDVSDGEEAAPVQKQAAQKATTAPRNTGGKYQVQLAALQTEAEAQKEWARLKTRYPTLFGSVTPAFVRTEQNNATFYRLRVQGFGAVADAKDFCTSVRERGMACMVVRP